MDEFEVIEVIDANTIKVFPKWRLTLGVGGEVVRGEKVRISGYRLPLEGTLEHKESIRKLRIILMRKMVTLRQPALLEATDITNGVIDCRVFLNEIDIAVYFPELKIRKPGLSQ